MPGKFIVIEGSDGSGKATQLKLIEKRLKSAGHDVATYDFPQYDQASSHFVQEYLNGKYGDGDELGAYGPSLFFALDRFQAAQSIRADLEAGKIVLSNRFTGSNMAHQGQKIHDEHERSRYYSWIHQVEFTHLRIPKPDLNIVLLVPAGTAQDLVDRKEQRSYTDKKRDIHEADLAHLQRATASYQALCEQFPDEYTRIQCTNDKDEILEIAAITERIWSHVQEISLS